MPRVTPLGDRAALLHYENETSALLFAGQVRQDNPPWLVDVVQAYASVAVFYNLDQVRYAAVEAWCLNQSKRTIESNFEPPRRHRIPCCYELGPDLARVAEHTGLSTDQVVQLHLDTEYTVYAIGFCPGFPYLGYLPPLLCGTPRLPSPRLRVEAGSVGITGRQTGIYTEPRPGGWNLVGLTPLELVNVRDGYFPLQTGDRVRFVRIDEAEYRRLKGSRMVE